MMTIFEGVMQSRLGEITIEILGIGLSCLFLSFFIYFIELHQSILNWRFFLLEYIIAWVLHHHLLAASTHLRVFLGVALNHRLMQHILDHLEIIIKGCIILSPIEIASKVRFRVEILLFRFICGVVGMVVAHLLIFQIFQINSC